MKKTLLLLPNLLSDTKHHEVFLPQSVDRAVATIDGLIAESESAGRRYLGRFQTKVNPRDIPIAVYNDQDIEFLLEPMVKGERWGFVSDAGLPCIADPGHRLVWRARELGINVKAFVGPSSILISLMLSGFVAQRFSFHGYLPKEPEMRKKAILQLQERAIKDKGTQIFIEAPYRNQETLKSLLETLSDETLLGAVWEIGSPDQGLLTAPISQWKKMALPQLKKRNVVFLIAP
jgi:16S rRNA (cytidine1402-2'-O)-methyltransferase